MNAQATAPGRPSRRAFLSTAAAFPLLASGASDDESVWVTYLAWLEGRPVRNLLGLQSYRKVLAESGLPKAEVERRMWVISERAFQRPEAMRLWFNSMFGPRGGTGPTWPTPFLVDVVKDLKPGAALDVCMGEGRNSIFLASLGWDVTGFDVSDVALENAQTKARNAGVEVRTIRSGYQNFDFGHEKWDLVLLTYAYFPIREKLYVDRLVKSLRPGGLLVFQHVRLKRGEDATGTASWLGIPEDGELKEIFRSLQILRYEQVEELPDYQTKPVNRKGRVVKMLAKKD